MSSPAPSPPLSAPRLSEPYLSATPRRRNAVLPTLLGLVLATGTAFGAIPSPPLDLEAPPAKAEKHPSGLHSLVLKEATGEVAPDGNDIVFVRLTAWTPAGQMFATNEDQPTPSLMRMDQIYPGFRIGLGLMKVGERRRLWIPAALGPVDAQGNPRGEAVLEVELIEVSEIIDFSAEWAQPPADAQRTASMASYVVLEEGAGEEEAGPESAVLLGYTGWTAADGTIFDSTKLRGRPTAFPLDKVLPAFADAVVGMKVGERRRIWIPGNVAKGQWVNSPQGDLIFDVMLMRLVELPEMDELPPGAVSLSDG